MVRSRFDYKTTGPSSSFLEVDTTWSEYAHTTTGVPLYTWVIDSMIVDRPGSLARVHASLTNAVFFANPNKASLPFVDKKVASDPTVFPPPADLKKMTPPDTVPQDIRRLQTRIFTAYRSGASQ